MKELLDTHWKDKTVRRTQREAWRERAPHAHAAMLTRTAFRCARPRATRVQVVFVGDSINNLIYHAAVRALRSSCAHLRMCAELRRAADVYVCSRFVLVCALAGPCAQLCEAAKVYDISFGVHAGTGEGDLHTRCDARARALRRSVNPRLPHDARTHVFRD